MHARNTKESMRHIYLNEAFRSTAHEAKRGLNFGNDNWDTRYKLNGCQLSFANRQGERFID